MNEFSPTDSRTLRQIERLLEHGRNADEPLLNELAGARPKADPQFQRDFEQTLLSQWPVQTGPVRPQPARRIGWMAAAAVLALALVAVALLRFGPAHEPGFAAQVTEPIAQPAAAFSLPDEYSLIGLPLPTDRALGLNPGDRVDVLAAVGGIIRVMVADVRLSEVTPEFVVLAAPAWKVAVMVPLSAADANVMLRLHTGPELPPRDETSVELPLIAPEVLPEDYRFDLMVNVPAHQGHLLVGAPYSMDDMQVNFDGEILRFRFTNLEVVSITRGTAVVIRLPRSDAANLDALRKLGMELTFIPDMGS